MAENWIDALNERDKQLEPEPELAIKAVPSGDDFNKENRRYAAAQPVEDPGKSFQLSRPGVVASAAIVGVLGIGIASVVTLSSSFNDDEQVVASEGTDNAKTVGVEAVSGNTESEVAASENNQDSTDSQVAIGSDCSVEITPDVSSEDSPRSAVTAFEEAYFGQDSDAIKQHVAKDSSLYKQDWETVLKDAAPKGTTWCATMQPAQGNAVDVDLKMTPPDERASIYRQTVTAEQVDGQWVVAEVAAREG